MRIEVIAGNSQRLDGGAMFGNAPRALWSRWLPVDANNCIELATRALYVQFDDGLQVLFEAGIGAFFEPGLKARYGVEQSQHVLLDSLAQKGIDHQQIDAVVLSHLHFDHAGGLLTAWSEGQAPQLLFPKARYLVSRTHWQRALHPHPRDKASFIPLLNQLLQDSGRLELVDDDQQSILDDRVRLHFSNGHTPGLMLSEISTAAGPLLYCSDLIPAAPWVHVPITMGYDRYPELLIDEKQALLEDLYQRAGRLLFTHDASWPCGKLSRDYKGRFAVSVAPLL